MICYFLYLFLRGSNQPYHNINITKYHLLYTMKTKITEQEVLKAEQIKATCIPHLSLDCVIFGYDLTQQRLKVLLLKSKRSKKWALPGGFIQFNEDLDIAAHRILNERTGAESIFLKQFQVFGNLNRSESYYQNEGGIPFREWFGERFVSIGYYALVNFTEVLPKTDVFSSACQWKSIKRLPELVMDHQKIINEALINMRERLSNKPMGYNLLPEKFTMPELQTLYEIILGRKINRGNFYRKMNKYHILNKLDEVRQGGAHKSPFLYSFNKEAYDDAAKNGLKDIW